MAVNKVTYGGKTLVDLTSDTVTPETLAEGVTAHDKGGNVITGTLATSVIPTYHYKAVGDTIKKIQAFKVEHPNHLVFGAVSDIHVGGGNTTEETNTKNSIKYASFALETIGAMTGCDFIANLGDLCAERHISTDPEIIQRYGPSGLVNAKYCIDALKPAFARVERYSIVGNHDTTKDTETQFNLIGAYNEFDVYASTLIRGYGYKDYADKKIRVVILNTCDYLYDKGGCALSYEQKDFLMRALDLSAKSDCAEWQILLLSHIPLDWSGGDYNYYADLQAILTAYDSGTTATITVNSSYAKYNGNETPSNYATYSSGKLVYNYSGKNSAKIIANIHGHLHNNKVGKIKNTSIARISTSNTSPYGTRTASDYAQYGDYVITQSELNAITKSFGSARDTSATFYCIDLGNQVVYSIGYGADIDRTIVYKSATIYSVSYELTNVTSSNLSTSIAEGNSYETTLSIGSAYMYESVTVTMGEVDITGDVWKESTGKIYIGEVTGNIVITATANEPLVSETITPHIAPRSTWYHGLTSSQLTLGPSNTEAALGVSTANSYAYTDRNGKTFYLMPIDSKYCKATLNYSSTDGNAVRYYLQAINISGSTYKSVATVGKGTNNVITWTAGAANYLLISIEHADGTTKWAWDSAGKTITVTFSNQ